MPRGRLRFGRAVRFQLRSRFRRGRWTLAGSHARGHQASGQTSGQTSGRPLVHQDGDDREEDDPGGAGRCRRHPRKDHPEPARRPSRARPDAVRRVHGAGARVRAGEDGLGRRGPAGARCPRAQWSGKPRRARLHGRLYARRRRPLHRQLPDAAPLVLGAGRHHGLPHRHHLGRRLAEPAVPGARPPGHGRICIAAASISRRPPCTSTWSR